MRISITCEECGRRHRLERLIGQGGLIWIVCHGCELPLRSELVTAPMAGRMRWRRLSGGHRRRLWAGLFDQQPAERVS